MDDPSNGGEVNEAVKLAPTLSAQTFDHIVGRSNGQRNHQKEGRHSDRDKRTFDDIAGYAPKSEASIEPEICQQMEKAIEEGVQAKHSPKLDEPINSGDVACWRDRKRNQQEYKR